MPPLHAPLICSFTPLVSSVWNSHEASILLPLSLHLLIMLYVVVEFPCFLFLLGFQSLSQARFVFALFGCDRPKFFFSEVLEHLVHGAIFLVVFWWMSVSICPMIERWIIFGWTDVRTS